mmetsp:Transcript_35987/g.99797  ORF Transcript_35987/g.99797 Transcript_35987/m.99797 type:complete len:215 (+) Transcript_35987:644-1288(+)
MRIKDLSAAPGRACLSINKDLGVGHRANRLSEGLQLLLSDVLAEATEEDAQAIFVAPGAVTTLRRSLWPEFALAFAILAAVLAASVAATRCLPGILARQPRLGHHCLHAGQCQVHSLAAATTDLHNLEGHGVLLPINRALQQRAVLHAEDEVALEAEGLYMPPTPRLDLRVRREEPALDATSTHTVLHRILREWPICASRASGSLAAQRQRPGG